MNLLAGTAAGALGALATQPLDCAKTRIQVGGALGGAADGAAGSAVGVAAAPRAGIVPAVRAIYAAEGARALWRGALARVLWLAPGCAISITTFEYVAAALKR